MSQRQWLTLTKPEYKLGLYSDISDSYVKRGLYSPAHFFVDNAAYFITSAICQKRPLLKPEPIKQHLLATIEACFHEKTGSWIIELF